MADGAPDAAMGAFCDAAVEASVQPAADAAALTKDCLWRGRLSFWQPAKRQGYRFNLDPVLLAGSAPAYPNGHVMDFGAGCGIVGILLLAQNKAARITAVEVQPGLAALIMRNAKANGFADRIEVIGGDLRHVALPEVDAVVFNPPYYPSAHFRPCAHPGRDQGRREQNGTLADFVRTALGVLVPGHTDKSMTAIVPASRYGEICRHIQAAGGFVSRAQEVWPKAAGPAAHVLVTAQRHRGRKHSAAASHTTATLSAPLVLHVGDTRSYTDEVNAWVDGPVWAGG